MASFELTPVEKGILRCRHSGEFTPADVQAMAVFFREYSGKLLIDLRGSNPEECLRHIKHLRPLMPTAAVFGAAIDPGVLEIDKSYYASEVRWFASEAEALVWLRNR